MTAAFTVRTTPRSKLVWNSDVPVPIVPMSIQDIAQVAASIHQLNVMGTGRSQRGRSRGRAWMPTGEFVPERETPLAIAHHDFHYLGSGGPRE